MLLAAGDRSLSSRIVRAAATRAAAFGPSSVRRFSLGKLHQRSDFVRVELARRRIVLHGLADCVIREARKLRGMGARRVVLDDRQNRDADFRREAMVDGLARCFLRSPALAGPAWSALLAHAMIRRIDLRCGR
jgi:hypothetical protein